MRPKICAKKLVGDGRGDKKRCMKIKSDETLKWQQTCQGWSFAGHLPKWKEGTSREGQKGKTSFAPASAVPNPSTRNDIECNRAGTAESPHLHPHLHPQHACALPPPPPPLSILGFYYSLCCSQTLHLHFHLPSIILNTILTHHPIQFHLPAAPRTSLARSTSFFSYTVFPDTSPRRRDCVGFFNTSNCRLHASRHDSTPIHLSCPLTP